MRVVASETHMDFPGRALAAIREHRLATRGDRMVVAVSGGPDSMALLSVLVELREALGLWLCVAHANHGLRGASSDADAEFVTARSAALGLPSRVGVLDVAGERRRRGGSLEMAARSARYAFLGQVAEEVDATRVAVGHTADDQVETILQQLLRGGGLRALRGMPVMRPLSPASGRQLVRPLLAATRADVLSYLEGRGVGFRVDETNADLSFGRNWVRHELLPLLEAHGQPGLRAVLLEAAGQARELGGVVEREAAALVADDGGVACLDVARLRTRPRLVRRMAFRAAYDRVGGTGGLTRRAVDAVEGLVDGPSGREARLGGGVVARRDYGHLKIGVRATGGCPVSVTLDVPGRVEVAELGLWVEARPWTGPVRNGAGRWEEVVDLDRVGRRLVVRTRRAGDRFRPLGLSGSKKLKDFLIDERVPRGDREQTLVVAGQCGIAWVVGLRLDQRARVRPETTHLARLRAGRLDTTTPGLEDGLHGGP